MTAEFPPRRVNSLWMREWSKAERQEWCVKRPGGLMLLYGRDLDIMGTYAA
jgi:hypothetical protein